MDQSNAHTHFRQDKLSVWELKWKRHLAKIFHVFMVDEPFFVQEAYTNNQQSVFVETSCTGFSHKRSKTRGHEVNKFGIA